MPSPADVLSEMSECIALLREYASSKGASCDRRQLSEFYDRLAKLLVAFERIAELTPLAVEGGFLFAGWRVDKITGSVTEKFDPTALRADVAEQERLRRIETELFIHTEWFYHTAWRLREIIHARSCGLPGLCGFEAVGVRDVRNHILQHPERYDSNRQTQSTAVSNATGPMLGSAYWEAPAKPFRDPGLFFNASEFSKNLKTRLLATLRDAKPPDAA